MISVSRIIVRAQHDRKATAGAVTNSVQEFRLRTAAEPVLPHADSRPVSEDKPGNVDGVTGCVFAPAALFAAIKAAAGKRAEMLNCSHFAAEEICGRSVDRVATPQQQRSGHRTDRGWTLCLKRKVIEARPVWSGALSLARRGQNGERNLRACEHGATRFGVTPQCLDLTRSRPAGRIAQVERDPGVVLGMLGKPPTARDKQRRREQHGKGAPVPRKSVEAS